MSFHFSNANGETIQLASGGVPVAVLPPGFSGPLTITGNVNVSTVQGYSVSYTTNIVEPDGIGPSTNGNCVVSVHNHSTGLISYGYAFPDNLLAPGPWPVGANISIWHTLTGIGNVGATVPDWTIAEFHVYGNAGSLWAEFVTPPPGVPVTNIVQTTNFFGGQFLGTFNGQSARLVQAQKFGIAVQTYAGHVEAVGWGLALGVLVFGHRWLMNVIGSIGREQDL